LTTQEAADRLGITRATVLAQIKKGRLRAFWRGRDHWILPREVERYRLESLGRVGRPEGAKDRRPRGKPAVLDQRPG
jgi:excisionase family DNA binding protein